MARFPIWAGLAAVALSAAAVQAGGGAPPTGGQKPAPPATTGGTKPPLPPKAPPPPPPFIVLMAAADADKDGSVTSDEWTAFLDGLSADDKGAVSLDDLASHLPPLPKDVAADPKLRDKLLVGAFDVDRDGVVTKSDLQAIYDKFAAHGGKLPPPPKDPAPGDKDPPPKDPAPGDKAPPPKCTGGRPEVMALMAAADQDGDKKVTSDEWTAFLAGLTTDADGAISLDDLWSKLPKPKDAPKDGGDTTKRDEHLTKAFDFDGDGVVTKADLQSIFDRVDKNEDGAAGKPELKKPKKPSGHDLRIAFALARAADADGDKSVTADEWTAFLDGLTVDDAGALSLDELASLLPSPKKGWPADNTKRDAALLRDLDTDKDGVVTKADLQAIFDSLDRNSDGALDANDAPKKKK